MFQIYFCHFRFQQLGDEVLYWQLPPEFLGNKVIMIYSILFRSNTTFQLSSYGGYLEFTLRYVPKPGENEPSDGEALVEIFVS